MENNYGKIDYTPKASQFFIKGYPRILLSRKNLWKNLYRFIAAFTAILLNYREIEKNLNF